ncbi:MAG: hypothetical protein ACJAT4_000307 [Granulosicoccus sp.]|jgi:hypothetical protein
MLLLLIVPCLAATSQNMDSISKALSRGDVESLSTYFDENVEIDDDFYDKSEAKAVVKKFFSKNPPKSFSLIHQGTSKDKDSKYFIGNLNAASGTFRVYVYMKLSGSQPLIQELRFDKE